MKIRKQKIVILSSICLLSVVTLTGLIAFRNSKLTNNDTPNNIQAEAEEAISYYIYDNQTEMIVILVTAKNENGIDRIEYGKKDGEKNSLNCNGKIEVRLDMQLEKDVEYEVKTISGEEQITKDIMVDDEEINGHAKIIKKEDTNVLYKYIQIEYVDAKATDTMYYKIGTDTTAWTKYGSSVALLRQYAEERDPENNDYIINLYTKKVDIAGNAIITKQKTEISDEWFDVFKDVVETGQSLSEYGFQASWSNSERRTFAAYNMRAGKWTNSGNYSGTFTLSKDNIKLDTINAIYVEFMQQADGSAWIQSSLQVVYTDDTSITKTVKRRTGGRQGVYGSYIAELELDITKTVSHIVMTIWRI